MAVSLQQFKKKNYVETLFNNDAIKVAQKYPC
jgi:hypothetical protein